MNRYLCNADTVFVDSDGVVEHKPCQRITEFGQDFCYYHSKVVDGLLEPADMPSEDQQVLTIVNKETGQPVWVRRESDEEHPVDTE